MTATPADNTKALKVNAHIGFKQEAILAHQFGKKRHAVIMRLLQPDYNRLFGEDHGQKQTVQSRPHHRQSWRSSVDSGKVQRGSGSETARPQYDGSKSRHKGSLAYEPTGTETEGIPDFKQITTLSPEQQGLYDTSTALQQNYGDIATAQLTDVGGKLETPFSLSSFGDAPGTPSISDMGAGACCASFEQFRRKT